MYVCVHALWPNKTDTKCYGISVTKTNIIITIAQSVTKHSDLPAYLHDDLHDYQPTRMLQSRTAHLLQRTLVLASVASRAFTVAAPTVWNSLSVNTQSADSFASFKQRLKSKLLYLLMPSGMAQHHHSAPIRILCD